jgi:hypothetical protein
MSAQRTTTFAAALAAAALSLSACGGGTDTKESTTTSASTSTSSSTSGGESSSSSSNSSTTTDGGGDTTSLDDAKVGDEVDAVKLGEVMTATFKDGATGHMTMDMGGITADGDFEVKGGKQNTAMTMEMGGQKMEMISIDGVTYMKGLAGGNKWVKSDASDAGTPDVNSFDPAQMSKAFAGTTAKVTDKSGGNTTYTLELDLNKLFAALSTEKPTGVTLPETIPVTYTLDGDNRPVKSTINMGMNIVVEYSDWGKKVSIKAPPSSEVTTMG